VSGLEARRLSKSLGGNCVIDDISFEIADGEFFVLLGPSGGGKSTILRLLCGLETPDSGDVVIAGRDVTRLPPRERNIGMVFQEYGLYPNMDVFHNVAYGLEARGMPKGEVQARVTQAAEILGLTNLLRQSVVDLSGGEQQRVALARALAKDADAYLYDEPLSNLDPKLRHHARRQIMDIHRRKRKPSLYVTHDQSEALAMADRIGVMAQGRLQQVGTPEQLLDEPRSMFVARFIGLPPMNLIPGRLGTDDGEYRFAADGVKIPLDRAWRPVLDRYHKQEVVLGVRSERLRLATAGDGAIGAVVEDVETMIGETSVVFRLPGGEALVGMFAQDLDSLEPGTPVAISVQAEAVVLFDPDTELSLRAR
jgi:multiple sugar transport system ATP-binding protein